MSDLHCAWCGAKLTNLDTYITYRGLRFDTEKCWHAWSDNGWRLAAKHREAMERRNDSFDHSRWEDDGGVSR